MSRLFNRCVHRHNRPAGAVRTFSYTIDGERIAARVSGGSAIPEGRYVELALTFHAPAAGKRPNYSSCLEF
jgi:hypothetical protein